MFTKVLTIALILSSRSIFMYNQLYFRENISIYFRVLIKLHFLIANFMWSWPWRNVTVTFSVKNERHNVINFFKRKCEGDFTSVSGCCLCLAWMFPPNVPDRFGPFYDRLQLKISVGHETVRNVGRLGAFKPVMKVPWPFLVLKRLQTVESSKNGQVNSQEWWTIVTLSD